MYTSEFTLEELKSKFNLTIQEQVALFQAIEPVKPSPLLRDILEENIPLALGVDTEKARSELIVAPILVDLRKSFQRQISIFSGSEFTVDKSMGLNDARGVFAVRPEGIVGRCDFIISHSPELLSINAPVVTIVEAKNDNIKSGLAQCIAEMIAAQVLNQNSDRSADGPKNLEITCIYGIVTTGSIWKFLRLEATTVDIEQGEHYLENLESILGILSHIVRTTRPNYLNGDK